MLTPFVEPITDLTATSIEAVGLRVRIETKSASGAEAVAMVSKSVEVTSQVHPIRPCMVIVAEIMVMAVV